MNLENIYNTKKVYFKCNVRKIDKINSLKEDFWCEFSITKYWAPNFISEEYLQQDRNSSKLLNSKSASEIFQEPKIFIKNLIKFTKLDTYYDIVTIDNTNYIEKSINYYAKLKGDFDFKNFPKDIQNLNIIIQACDDSTIVRLEHTPYYKSILNANNVFQHRHEWNLYNKLTVNEVVTNYASSTRNKKYSQLYFNFSIKRNSNNYFWNIILLNFLITLTSLSSYNIEHTDISERLQLNSMLLLTNVAFKNYQTNLTPNISYFTFLDKYVFTGIGFLFTVILQNSISNSEFFRDDNTFDYYGYTILSGLFVFYNTMFSFMWLKK